MRTMKEYRYGTFLPKKRPFSAQKVGFSAENVWHLSNVRYFPWKFGLDSERK